MFEGSNPLLSAKKSPEWRVIARNSGLSLVKRRYGEILEKYKALRVSQIQINNPRKAESQIATLLFLYQFSGYACGIYHLTNRQRTVWERSQQ